MNPSCTYQLKHHVMDYYRIFCTW